MRNFRRVLLFVAVVIMYECVFSFLLEPVTYQHFLEMELRQDKEKGITPDMVVIGNSSVEMAFVPSVLEREIGEVSCVLNAGTGSQMIWGTYYYLKDLLRQYDIKYAVVGIDYSVFVRQENRVPRRDLVVLDRIRSADIRADYMKNFLKGEEYVQLLKSYRYRENMGHILENLDAKLDGDYWKGIDAREDANYRERGYVHSVEKGELYTGIYELDETDMDAVSGQAMDYLDRIVDMCREEGVELFLVVPPSSFCGVYGSETYQSAVDYFNAYASEKGIPFCDLNLMRDRVRVLPDSMLSDEGHLGENGAVICSGLYGRMLNEQMAGGDVSGYFHVSVEEMKKDVDGIVACDFATRPYGENGDRMIEARSICGEGVVPEYEYWVCGEGKQWVKLQEYGGEAQCLLPAEYLEGKTMIQVNCRRKGGDVEWERQIRRSREPGM